MEPREENIVDAAVRVFSRYGVRRTTMNDIAAEAGIARQSVYNSFANKDEVLRGAIRLSTERAKTAIEDGCAAAADLDEKLEIVFEFMFLRPYEVLRTFPDADDIMNGYNEAGRAEIAIAVKEYDAVIENILRPYDADIRRSGLTVPDLARSIRVSAKAAKYDASDVADLKARLHVLKVMVLAVAG